VRSIKKYVTKSYPQDIFTAGKNGYRLFAATAKGGGTRQKKGPAGRDRWTTTVPVRARAMVLTPRHVVLAGTPDVVRAKDPWATLENRAGGVLAIHARADGEQVVKMKLKHAPVNDGLATAEGRLYLTTVGGTVMCIGR